MPPWSSTISISTLRRWRSRAELRQAYLDSLSPEELRRVHLARYWPATGYALAENGEKGTMRARRISIPSNRATILANGSLPGIVGRRQVSAKGRAMIRAKVSPLLGIAGDLSLFCMAQYAVDGLMCNSVEPASRRAGCWKQAAERLGNCLAGREVPPLNF